MERIRSAAISATVEEMGGEDVVGHVGRARYDAIKRRDDHPMFIKLKVGYEGISHGSLTVGGKTVNQAKRWHRACIDELADALNFGSPGLFIGHENKDTRPRLGEIMGAFTTDDTEGRRTAPAIAYVGDRDVRPKIRDGSYPKCSVQADILNAGLETDEPFVQTVEAATAIVLAGPEQRAGFEHAGVEAVIAETIAEIKNGSIDEMNTKDDKTKSAGELYSRNELLEDPVVKSLIDAGRESLYTQLTDAKKKLDGLEATAQEKETQIQAMKKTLSEAGATANAGRVSAAIDKAVADLKLTTKEKDLVKNRLARSVKVDSLETSDEDIAATVEAAAKNEEADALEYRKIYGKPGDDKSGEGDDRETDTTEDEGTGEGETDPFLAANKLKPEQVA